MSTSATPNAKELFADAVELPPAERDGFLREACRERESLLTEVRELLAIHDRAHRFLAGATGESQGAPATIAERAGSAIGPYKLLQAIGESERSTVFMAEQRAPMVRRVALKVIKTDVNAADITARCVSERQILATMDDPNIAKVLDAGITDSGRPYFVMELVKGEPITTYCDSHMLTIPERLGLFAEVCEAVQRAHSNGVTHRGIRPTNILVSMQDGRPLPKVIDFGTAKASAGCMTESTGCPEVRQVITTPKSTGPEQAGGGKNVDIRTDVHALGVVLYELLTGSAPFDPDHVRSAANGELQGVIREVDSDKPSTRLPTSLADSLELAAHRQIGPTRLGMELREGLEWIVRKALEKSPGRMYETANGLAADIRRYLVGETGLAGPSNVACSATKSAQRHRMLLLVTGVLAAAAVLGVIGAATGLWRGLPWMAP